MLKNERSLSLNEGAVKSDGMNVRVENSGIAVNTS